MLVLRSLSFPSRRDRTRALSSEYKLAKVILQTGCPSYHLTSSSKIPESFNQHGLDENTKKYLGINALISSVV